MLGSFQRAHKLLQNEVAKLKRATLELDGRIKEQEDAKEDLDSLQQQCNKVREENEELRRRLEKHGQSRRRDSQDIMNHRTRLKELSAMVEIAQKDTREQAQKTAQEHHRADLNQADLAQLLCTQAALEETLLVHWEMLEDLAQQFNLDPPWQCSLCSAQNPQDDQSCRVCDSPKGGKTDCGGRAVEAYFEFRLHQEFLGRDPPPGPEARLAALRIALGHRTEKWIQRDEIEELYVYCKGLAQDLTVDTVMRAEAAFVLFTMGEEAAQRIGRMLLLEMGGQSDAVRIMCRRLRQQRVAVLYHRLMQMQKYDLKRFNAWKEKMEQAQRRFHRLSTMRSSRELPYSPSSTDRSMPTTPSAPTPASASPSSLAATTARSSAIAKFPDVEEDDEAEEEECDSDNDENKFPLPTSDIYSAAGFSYMKALWSTSQLTWLLSCDKWIVGETWTLSVVATSLDSVIREFGFNGGGGGFLKLIVPVGATGLRITVTDTVKQVTTKFAYRGKNGNVGDVFFTDVYIGPGSNLPEKYAVDQ